MRPAHERKAFFGGFTRWRVAALHAAGLVGAMEARYRDNSAGSGRQTQPEVEMTLGIFISAVLLLCPLLASAQVAVTVSPVNVTGQKAVVPLAMKNGSRVTSSEHI